MEPVDIIQTIYLVGAYVIMWSILKLVRRNQRRNQNMKNLDKILENYRALNKSLSVPVLIDSEEVLKIVIADLRQKRNAISNNVRKSFDDVLLYYLGEDDFEKYITNNHEID